MKKKPWPHLQPYIKQKVCVRSSNGKIIMATVKGDVHDIVKKYVAVVLPISQQFWRMIRRLVPAA